MRYEVEVTEQDIVTGYPESPSLCPIARAIGRTLRLQDLHSEIIVDASRVRLRRGEDWWMTSKPLASKISQFIRDFDSNRPVKPFKFGLKVKDTEA